MEELINYQRFVNRKWLTIILCVLGGELGWVHWYNGNSGRAWGNWLCAIIGGLALGFIIAVFNAPTIPYCLGTAEYTNFMWEYYKVATLHYSPILPTVMWFYIMCTTFWRILDAQTLEELYAISDMTLEDVEKNRKANTTDYVFIATITFLTCLIAGIIILAYSAH